MSDTSTAMPAAVTITAAIGRTVLVGTQPLRTDEWQYDATSRPPAAVVEAGDQVPVGRTMKGGSGFRYLVVVKVAGQSTAQARAIAGTVWQRVQAAVKARSAVSSADGWAMRQVELDSLEEDEDYRGVPPTALLAFSASMTPAPAP